MVNLLVSPGAPYFSASVGFALLAALGILQIARRRNMMIRLRLSPVELTNRLLIGNLIALPIVALLLFVAFGSGLQGSAFNLVLATAVMVWLYAGLVVPRRPLVQARKERVQLRKLTPALASFIRVSLAGVESPAVILERYAARPSKRLKPMQRITEEALVLMREQRVRPFEALAIVARQRECRELVDLATSLAQAEAEGTDPTAALESLEITLDAVLRDEFTRLINRRTLYLLVLVAISLVIGVLCNLLFVMTRGGQILMGR